MMASNHLNGEINVEKEHLKKYKNVAKHEDMRRRRTECSVELRKQKREDALMKRRNIACDGIESESCTDDESSRQPMSNGLNVPKVLTIPEIVGILQNDPSIDQLRIAFEAIRRLLSRSKDAPVDEVIQSGLIEALVQALYVEDERVHFEAAWGLTNIVSGTTEQTMAVVNQGAVPPLVALCKSSSLQVTEQACWAIGNIAGENADTRNLVLEAGILEAIDPLFNNLDELSVDFVRTLAWLHSNLCRHKSPALEINVLRIIAARLKKCLVHSDAIVRQDSCWALGYLTDGSDDQVNVALETGCFHPAIALLQSDRDAEVAPALRVVGNFAAGSDILTQVVVDNGILDTIKSLMKRTRSQAILKECCWVLSNVIAGTREQINAVIKAKLISSIISVLETGDNRSKVEASWAFANLSQGGTARQILSLAERDYIKVFCNSLVSSNHADLLVNILETLFFLLTTLSNQTNSKMSLASACECIEEFGGLENLEALQQHANEKVYAVSYKIIDHFFNDEEEGDEKVNLSVDGHFEF